MKKVSEKKFQVRFSTPDPKTNIVRVSRILTDGNEESIGMIYPVYNEEQELVEYHSVSDSGEQVAPPSVDFSEIEIRFEKSIKENHERSFREDMESQIEEYERRGIEVCHLRVIKKRNSNRVINR